MQSLKFLQISEEVSSLLFACLVSFVRDTVLYIGKLVYCSAKHSEVLSHNSIDIFCGDATSTAEFCVSVQYELCVTHLLYMQWSYTQGFFSLCWYLPINSYITLSFPL